MNFCIFQVSKLIWLTNGVVANYGLFAIAAFILELQEFINVFNFAFHLTDYFLITSFHEVGERKSPTLEWGIPLTCSLSVFVTSIFYFAPKIKYKKCHIEQTQQFLKIVLTEGMRIYDMAISRKVER